jgi:hypothetical protein
MLGAMEWWRWTSPLADAIAAMRAVYDALQATAKRDGVHVSRIHRRLFPYRGQLGWFTPRFAPLGIAKIHIVCHHTTMPHYFDDMVEEVITLAHELGHFRSFRAGVRTAEYEAALDRFDDRTHPRLTEEECRLIVKEERHAWRFAREELEAIGGFGAWAAFDAREAAGDRAYDESLAARR